MDSLSYKSTDAYFIWFYWFSFCTCPNQPSSPLCPWQCCCLLSGVTTTVVEENVGFCPVCGLNALVHLSRGLIIIHCTLYKIIYCLSLYIVHSTKSYIVCGLDALADRNPEHGPVTQGGESSIMQISISHLSRVPTIISGTLLYNIYSVMQIRYIAPLLRASHYAGYQGASSL